MFLNIVLSIAGFVAGTLCIFVLIEPRARRAKEAQERAAAAREDLERTRQSLESKRALLEKQSTARANEHAEVLRQAEQTHLARRALLDAETAQLEKLRKEFDHRAVTYSELQKENAMLKRDLRNIEIAMRKLKLDRDAQHGKQQELDSRSRDLASRYLKESVHWINAALDTSNFAASRQRLKESIERCRAIGFRISSTEEETLLDELQAGFERSVRIASERAEQTRAQVRIHEAQKPEHDRKLWEA